MAAPGERSRGEGVFTCVGAELTSPRVDVWEHVCARLLWTRSAIVEPMPALRRLKALARSAAQAATGGKGSAGAGGVLLLGYDVEAEAARVHKLENAQRALALKRAAEAPKRDGYVKGAMEWERNAWKVWDTKKEAEEKRRDRYGRALTHYIGGNKIVVREEPPALTQCAHCDLGGGVHALRRCMGCFAVAYCCKLHQKVHWQWHKHICFAIRAANNLEARKGEGAGWVKLRPRRWRRPPIEKGAVVETNCRMRWANWKQFYTNGAMPMLNMMGDGGPLVAKAWDEALATMAMCEEATFVFGVKEVQRMMMPFVAARRAPPGTVLVVEVGLIDVRRENGRRREVDDYLWFKNKAEKRQDKMDRIDEQKMKRLRDRRERDERTGAVQRLLLASNQEKGAELQKQKDGHGEEMERGGELAGAGKEAGKDHASAGADVDGVHANAGAGTAGDREVWEEPPEIDYEAFEEALAMEDPGTGFEQEGDGEDARPTPAWMPPGAAEAPLSLTSIPRDASEGAAEPRKYVAPFVPGVETGMEHGVLQGVEAGLEPQQQHVAGEPVTAGSPGAGAGATGAAYAGAEAGGARDGWGAIDSFVTVDPRALQKSAIPTPPAPAAPAAGMPDHAAPGAPGLTPAPTPGARGSMYAILEQLGLASAWDLFVAAGQTDAKALAALGPEAGPRLASLGLKLGQRQRVLNALARM